MDVYAEKTSENSSFCTSEITLPNRAKICCAPKTDATLSSISISLKFIHFGLGFYKHFNILKNVCNRSSCHKFLAIELNRFFTKEIYVQGRLALNFGKNHPSVQIL